MSQLNILSWNAQGFIAKRDNILTPLINILGYQKFDLVFIMEAGNLEDNYLLEFMKGYGYYVMEQNIPNAKNLRCSDVLFAKRNRSYTSKKVGHTDIKELGENSRPLFQAIENESGINIGFRHFTASANKAESEIIGILKAYKDDKFIMIGDFNVEPFIISEKIASYNFLPISKDHGTQGPAGRRDKILDYAIRRKDVGAVVNYEETVFSGNAYSDHLMLKVTIYY